MRVLAAALFLLVQLTAVCRAQWSAQPGETVRDAFGPVVGERASVCRGACGAGCPASCAEQVAYECSAPGRLRKVRIYECGTHQGCREHDDCLDRCLQRNVAGFDCQASCHREAVSTYGIETAGSWAAGGGPFDGDPIVFEYTRQSPGAPEAAYRCPEGARRECSGAAGRCVDSAGASIAPVFDSYPAGGPGDMRIAGFRSGRVCQGSAGPSGVCEPAVNIQVTGDEPCRSGGAETGCTWYGFELDYENADASQPLLCTSAGGEEDFLGGVVAGALAAAPANRNNELGAALGHLQDQLAGGSSLKDVLSGISIKPIGQPGSPSPAPQEELPPPPGVPGSVELAAASGHLLVPMYEKREGATPGTVVVREVRCTHRGEPVLEATFRLSFSR